MRHDISEVQVPTKNQQKFRHKFAIPLTFQIELFSIVFVLFEMLVTFRISVVFVVGISETS